MTIALKKGNAETISKPAAFHVMGTEGPFRSGEEDKAASWTKQLLTTLPR